MSPFFFFVFFFFNLTSIQFFAFWFNQTQDLSRSRFTRLLTADKPDELMDKIPTFLCKPPEELRTDNYLPYNKIVSVLEWIEAKHTELSDDTIVVIIDVDVVLLEDISYLAVNVKQGSPMGAKGFMSFTGEDTPMDRMVSRYAPKAAPGFPTPALAVPYFLHKADILALAPRWRLKCREIRADTVPWSKVNDWRAEKATQLSWTAEQWAFLLAAAEMGLRFEVRARKKKFFSYFSFFLLLQVRDDVSAFTGCGVLSLQEPMLHFSMEKASTWFFCFF